MIPISNFICHWKISHHKLWLSIVRQLVSNWNLVVAAHDLVVHNLVVHNLVVHNSVVQHKVETEFHWLRTRNHHIWCRDRALVYLLLRLILSWSWLKTVIVNNNICCWLHDWLNWCRSCDNCCLRMCFFIFSFESILHLLKFNKNCQT